MGGRQIDQNAERELSQTNFGPLEAHSGIQNGRCEEFEEFDLSESYLAMHVTNFAHDSDSSAKPNSDTVHTSADIQSMEKCTDYDSDASREALQTNDAQLDTHTS